MADAAQVRAVDTGCAELLCSIEARVALVTLNRPEARNALTMELREALRRLIPALGADDARHLGAS